MPRLSLCMIVRDEADMLPDFLAATEGLRDQFIVVDTGSRDRTPELLAAAGAEIHARPWDGDFAAARNASLAPATGEWILFLDADERPTPALRDQILALLDDPSAGAATIRMRNLLPHGHARESDLLRLWRRDPEVRFRHRIHEEVASTVTTMLARRGLRLLNLPGRCDHLGYIRDVAEGRAKKERDRELLTACVADDPDDWYSWYKLLELARFWSDRPLWHDTAQQVVARLDGPPPARLPRTPWSGELVALAAQGLFPAASDQIRWLDRWESRVPPSPAFHLRRALAHEQSGDLDAAAADFQRCRDLPAGALPMNTTVRPLLGLCRVAAQRGDLRTAADLVHQALAHNPRDPESLLAAVSFAWLEGGREAHDRFVAEHRELHGDSEELALAVAEHALQIAQWELAEQVLRPVAGDPPRGRPGLLLGQALLGRGEVAAAATLCRELMPTLPAAAMGYLTCCLVQGEQVDLSVDLQQHEADQALKEWVALLWRSRQAPLMSAFVDHFPLVAGTFPWLPQFLADQTEQLKRRLR